MPKEVSGKLPPVIIFCLIFKTLVHTSQGKTKKYLLSISLLYTVFRKAFVGFIPVLMLE